MIPDRTLKKPNSTLQKVMSDVPAEYGEDIFLTGHANNATIYRNRK